jgi:hypothetical protein
VFSPGAFRCRAALLFTRRIAGHIVPSGKDCRLFGAGERSILDERAGCNGREITLQFRDVMPTPALGIHSWRKAMRDEPIMPIDRGDAKREDATAPAAAPSTAQADGTSADPQSDSPAPLAAAPHLADAEEPGLSDEEIAMYRRRVADGTYNTREVADEVARRMMRRGDI